MGRRSVTVRTARGPVSAVRTGPGEGPLLVLAHGAGGDLGSPFLEGFARGLADGAVGCLRFNFPYRERGAGRPDPEPVLRATWEAAFGRARSLADPVWAGGKSLGGRIASMLVAEGMPAAGPVLVGYPLHPPGRPEQLRDVHLASVPVPMLFLQGTRDPFARWDLIRRTVGALGDRATLYAVEDGDHSFRVRGAPGDEEGTGRRLGAVAAAFVAGSPP